MRFFSALAILAVALLALHTTEAAAGRLGLFKGGKGGKGKGGRAVQPPATPPAKVAMFTVASPCQHTQAAAYYFTAKVKAEHQTAHNELDILYVVDADDDEKNGIVPWRQQFKDHVTDVLKAKDSSLKCYDGLKAKVIAPKKLGDSTKMNPKGDRVEKDCPMSKLKEVAKDAIVDCKKQLKARYTAMSGQLSVTKDATWGLGGTKGSCALACALAMVDSDNVKSCSATYSSVKGGSTEFGISLSQSSVPSDRPATIGSTYAHWYNTAPGHSHKAFTDGSIRKYRDQFVSLADGADTLPKPASLKSKAKLDIFVKLNRGGCSEDTALHALEEEMTE